MYHWESSGVAVFRNQSFLNKIKCTDADLSTSNVIDEIELSKIPAADEEENFHLYIKIHAP